MINGKDQEIITINKTGNSILNNAKYSADNTDEWYTTYETIAEELSHYKNQFIDKVVLCNCDDPFESNFCYYFLRHFNQLKLKKLICTSYRFCCSTQTRGLGLVLRHFPTKNDKRKTAKALWPLRLWEILILLYGDCTSTFMVGSTVALAGIFLTGFPPFPDVLCINKLCFI